MDCANTVALNEYLDKQDYIERKWNELLKVLESDFEELAEIKRRIMNTASNFEGLDFSEDIKSEIEYRL